MSQKSQNDLLFIIIEAKVKFVYPLRVAYLAYLSFINEILLVEDEWGMCTMLSRKFYYSTLLNM